MKIKKLITSTAEPVSVYKAGTATIEIYKAKNAGTASWENSELFRLVARARESYYQYTKEPPLFDEYEDKSAVYITKAVYPIEDHQCHVEEWVSVRFIPGQGSPLGFQDLTMYEYEGKRIDVLAREKLFPKKEGEAFWERFVSISKLCVIRPHFLHKEHCNEINSPRKLSYTGLALVFMTRQFFKDAPAWNLKPAYITAQIPKDVVEKSLKVVLKDSVPLPRFTLASAALSLPNQNSVRLTRNTYTYHYPVYFFNFPSILSMLRKLYQEGKISESTLQHYLGVNISLEDLANLPLHKSMLRLRKLGDMFVQNGQLAGATITGEDLRTMTDMLEDGPSLYIMASTSWKEDIENVCSKLGIRVD
ncbi:MAG TPA: hypothetical protein VGA53_01300 [Candidatus Paceibacterota bacterium]